MSTMNDIPSVLQDYNLYGWIPDSSRSDEEISMELIYLLTRQSQCRQGHMACMIHRTLDMEPNSTFLERIVSVSINTSLYREYDSDNHAEINAIGAAAKHGISTNGCTLVVTMPPCKRCFGALLVAGIRRVVTSCPVVLNPVLMLAEKHQIEIVVVNSEAAKARIAHITSNILSREHIEAARARRKEERSQRQMKSVERKTKKQSKPNKSEDIHNCLNCD
jgi:deoxycytidylate deaminase